MTEFDYEITSIRPHEDLLIFTVNCRDLEEGEEEVSLLCLNARQTTCSVKELSAMKFFFEEVQDHLIWIGESGEGNEKVRYVFLELKHESPDEQTWQAIKAILIPD